MSVPQKIGKWCQDQNQKCLWLVVDDYQMSNNDLQTLRQYWRAAGCDTKVMIMDDHQYRSSAHLRLAPMSDREMEAGGVESECPVLFGLEYLLMRPEFSMESMLEPRDAWLICFGGADTEGLTGACIQRMIDSGGAQQLPRLIVCASDRMAESQGLDAMLKNWPGVGPAQRKSWVDAKEMASLLQSSLAALVSCSGIATEALAMQTPIVGVSWVDNQKNHAKKIASLGIPIVKNDPFERAADHLLNGEASIGQQAAGAVDPYGAWRVAAVLLQEHSRVANGTWSDPRTEQTAEVFLRKSTFLDGQMLLDWRNDPATRAASMSTEKIPLASHLKWYARTLFSKNRTLYILEMPGDVEMQECASGRLDFEEEHDEVELSWTVAPHARGKRLSYIVASLILNQVPSEYRAIATIKSENVASKKVAAYIGMHFLEHVSEGVEKWRIR